MITRMPPPSGCQVQSRRGRSLNSRVLQLSTFALSFIGIALLVVTSSRAAFVAQNDNIANSVSSAAIDLTDDDSNTAMFVAGTVTNLMPNTDVDRCITVSYSGNVTPTEVKMYIASALPAGDLSDYLNLRIDIGPAISQPFRSCTGFTPTATLFDNNDLLGFATAHPNYATTPMATGWTPASPSDARTFRFRISVQDVPAAEGKSTTFGFSWETRTTS